MGNWVTLTELGERRCTAIKIQLSSTSDIDNSGNYNFTREYGVQGEEWGMWGSGYRFDLTARNVCDFNINGGSDTYYRDLNAETYQGEYNGKEYYITYDGEYVQWEWTEPVYYYSFDNNTGGYDPEPVAADFIYVMLEEPITIADNLNRIIKAKADIKTAIENKGVVVGDITIDGYAEKIGKIPQGDASFSGLDFTVIGYDMALTSELNDKFNADIQYSYSLLNKWDKNTTNAMLLYYTDKDLVYAPLIVTQNVTNMYAMFNSCSNLMVVPQFDTSKVTDMSDMFHNCLNLKTVPQFDTSNVTNMYYMFHGCSNLMEVPQFDTSNVTTVERIFYNCPNLRTVPLLDFSNVTKIDRVFGLSENTPLTTLGGFKGLKIDWNDNYGLAKCPNLSYESVMNVINNLYDFRANGDETTTKTIKFHANSLALLSDDDKAIATNRGWVLS